MISNTMEIHELTNKKNPRYFLEPDKSPPFLHYSVEVNKLFKTAIILKFFV